MTLKLCSIAAALALAFTANVQAQTTREGSSMERKLKNAEEERIEADAKAAKAQCDTLKDNAKDVCMAEAKAKEKLAKAELDAKKNPSQRNQRKAAETKAEGAYEVAKEKCDDQKGQEKDACQKEARATYERAKADIKKQFAARKDERPARSATSGATGK